LATSKFTKRLRVFAGPNGSGKSTIIESLRTYPVAGHLIDFGTYINADDINRDLLHETFSFDTYELSTPTRAELIASALTTGLINGRFTEQEFKGCFSLNSSGSLKLKSPLLSERLAQLLAALLRDYLLLEGRKMSFETVLSHPSKVAFMDKARRQGYKVYLYYVATEAPEISISRIKEVRVRTGGHDVPDQTIRDRYKRSLDLMYEAAETAYQAFFFDNTESGENPNPDYFAHFRVVGGKKQWDPINPDNVPSWFDRYYLDKL
jgi:predicted ABC-type ATPase